jgi:hypothetical protein
MMNESARELVFFVTIIGLPPIGIMLLGWTMFESIFILSLFSIVKKLTDIQDTLGDKRNY